MRPPTFRTVAVFHPPAVDLRKKVKLGHTCVTFFFFACTAAICSVRRASAFSVGFFHKTAFASLCDMPSHGVDVYRQAPARCLHVLMKKEKKRLFWCLLCLRFRVVYVMNASSSLRIFCLVCQLLRFPGAHTHTHTRLDVLATKCRPIFLLFPSGAG